MKSKLGERGQVVIPKAYRDRLGLRGGQLLEFREERGQLIVSKSREPDGIDAVYGILKGMGRTDDLIRELRGGEPDAVDEFEQRDP